jgi:hypothetical protein
VTVPERKARHGPCHAGPHAGGSAQSQYVIPSFGSCQFIRPVVLACLFDLSCHKQPVDKKTGKYFIFIEIFEPTEYDDHNI